MREICKSGSEGGAGQTNVPFLPLSRTARATAHLPCSGASMTAEWKTNSARSAASPL